MGEVNYDICRGLWIDDPNLLDTLLDQVDINRYIFYRQHRYLFLDLTDERYNYLERESNSENMFNAAEVVLQIVLKKFDTWKGAVVYGAQVVSASEIAAQKTILERLMKRKPQIRTSLINEVKKTQDELLVKIHIMQEHVQILDSVIYGGTAQSLSRSGFGYKALDWAMDPNRENLMKRRYEHGMSNIENAKQARTRGGKAYRRRSKQSVNRKRTGRSKRNSYSSRRRRSRSRKMR